MNPLRPVLALLIAASLAAPADAQRTCGTAAPSQAEVEQILGTLRDQGRAMTHCSGTIVVAFHVLHDGSAGLLTQSQVDAQIAEMNANFAALMC